VGRRGAWKGMNGREKRKGTRTEERGVRSGVGMEGEAEGMEEARDRGTDTKRGMGWQSNGNI